MSVSGEPLTPLNTESRTPNETVPAVPPVVTEEHEPVTPEVARDADRIISGIDLVDYSAGGLYPEKVYVVKGATGTGKSIAGLQFLTRGLEQHENGILITTQKPDDVLLQARNIGFALDEPVRRGQLVILNPSRRYFELIESPADILAIMDELGDYVKKMDAKRLVIDPIYALVNTSYSGQFAISVTHSILNALDEVPVTTLVIAGSEQDAENVPVIRALEEGAYGVINLAADAATGGRRMHISKLRFAATDNLAAHYRILNGRGLINYDGSSEQVSDVTQPWEESSATSRSVLLLGANGDTINKVKEALGDSYSVSAETDFRKGIELARNQKPGVILVSPTRSQSAIAAILDLAHDSASSIAFLSPSENRASDRVLYLRAGADDFLTEPFSPAELRARIDALIRRSGRRLTVRGETVPQVTPEDIRRIGKSTKQSATRQQNRCFVDAEGRVAFSTEFREKLDRNLQSLSRLDTDLAVVWLKHPGGKSDVNRTLARLCRQEDVVCHNADGEFVAILPGADENGIRGFEARVNEKLGAAREKVCRGHAIFRPGDEIDVDRALAQQ